MLEDFADKVVSEGKSKSLRIVMYGRREFFFLMSSISLLKVFKSYCPLVLASLVIREEFYDFFLFDQASTDSILTIV